MTWYSAGTIAVTNGSKTVTGTGTAWVGAIRAGWAMVAPDSKIYEIAQVVSATSLKLTNNYVGTNQTGQVYAVMPTQGADVDLASAIVDLTSNYQGVYDGPGQGKFPDGSVSAPGVRFTADTDTGMRRVGANKLALVAGGADQLALSGGTATGAAVQASATDDTAGRLMRADYGYSPGNLVGTVSQSAGTPTGAVIEQGGNANGEYTRWADGTQICTVSGLTTSASADTTWTYPAAFTFPPHPARLVVTGVVPSIIGASAILLVGGIANGTSVGVNAIDLTGARLAKVAHLMAVGQWY